MGRKSKQNDWPPEQILELRRDLELSQAELAEILRCHATAVQKWETGKRQPSGSAQVLLSMLMAKLELDNSQ